ncbi:hypothetical protein [Saccharothrix sp. NRRL B-16348]|uniref:hypothetical protein n=1 Tax=Saccharothrix sp. NRRL B-16348 TaxID=1415542 RepID=UPI0012FACF37|nr:hypothetical protein [Saccharothrix sp. NRRL B-16348]
MARTTDVRGPVFSTKAGPSRPRTVRTGDGRQGRLAVLDPLNAENPPGAVAGRVLQAG